MLMLHGCTQNPEDFALGTKMNALADEFGLIVAYPHQTRRANPNGCWNWFDRRHQNRGSGEPAKLAGLAQALAKEFDVRRERVFAAGLSAGGAMAEILAATYPDVFEAVGIHSGLPYKSAGDVPSAFAAMKGTAAFDPAPPAASGRHAARSSFTGWPTEPSIPSTANASSMRSSAERLRSLEATSTGQSRAAASAAPRSRTTTAGRSRNNGWSKAAATPGSAAIRAAAIRRPSASTPPGSWCAFSWRENERFAYAEAVFA